MIEKITKSEEETLKFAKSFAKKCKKGDVVLLYGDLGAGKTVFARGFVSAYSAQRTTSPTFTIINTYPGKTNIYHFDLYRIESEDELYEIGAREYIYSDGICLIEWPERAPNIFPKNSIKIRIEKLDDNTRKFEVDNENFSN